MKWSTRARKGNFLGDFSQESYIAPELRLGGQSRRKDLLGYPLLIWCALVTCPHLPGSSQTCASSLLFPWWPLTGPLLKGLSKWNVQLTAPILPLYVKKLEENPNEVKEKKKKTVLGILLCSSLYTNGMSGHYTENIPTKWESIALIWPSPKYSHIFFCSKYTQLNLWMEEMVVGNWAESTGNNDS